MRCGEAGETTKMGKSLGGWCTCTGRAASDTLPGLARDAVVAVADVRVADVHLRRARATGGVPQGARQRGARAKARWESLRVYTVVVAGSRAGSHFSCRGMVAQELLVVLAPSGGAVLAPNTQLSNRTVGGPNMAKDARVWPACLCGGGGGGCGGALHCLMRPRVGGAEHRCIHRWRVGARR